MVSPFVRREPVSGSSGQALIRGSAKTPKENGEHQPAGRAGLKRKTTVPSSLVVARAVENLQDYHALWLDPVPQDIGRDDRHFTQAVACQTAALAEFAQAFAERYKPRADPT